MAFVLLLYLVPFNNLVPPTSADSISDAIKKVTDRSNNNDNNNNDNNNNDDNDNDKQ
ncbi:MAG: hypothetical protein P0116_10160 [Candidatus Nitrosocosmicus sp.]|nr:hypothetical protein [Candidatus Nitrosocosmicus sp.]